MQSSDFNNVVLTLFRDWKTENWAVRLDRITWQTRWRSTADVVCVVMDLRTRYEGAKVQIEL